MSIFNKIVVNKENILNLTFLVALSIFVIFGAFSKDIAKTFFILSYLLFAITNCFSQGKFRWKCLWERSFIDPYLLCFGIICTVSALFSIDASHSIEILTQRYFFYFLIFTIGVRIGKDNSLSIKFLKLLIASALIVSAGVIYDFVLYFLVNARFEKIITAYGINCLSVIYFSCVVPAVVFWFMFAKGFTKKTIALLGLGIVAAAVLFYYSRALWLALPLALFPVIFFAFPKKRVYLLVATAAAVLLVFSYPPVKERILSGKTLSPAAWSERVQMWWVAVKTGVDNPITGSGVGTFEFILPEYKDFIASGDDHHHAHNTYFEVFAELGIFGFLSFLFLFAAYLRKAFVAFPKDCNKRIFAAATLASVLTVLWSEITVTSILVGVYTPLLFWLLFGTACGCLECKEG